jgi:hypothetical protein
MWWIMCCEWLPYRVPGAIESEFPDTIQSLNLTQSPPHKA